MADEEEIPTSPGFLDHWLASLSRGLCDRCSTTLRSRIRSVCRRGTHWEAFGSGLDDGPLFGSKRTGWDVAPPASSESPRAIGARETGWGVRPPVPSKLPRISLGTRTTGRDVDFPEEVLRFKSIGRKKDFSCLERMNGKPVNILQGIELHTGVFSASEQKEIVDFVYELQRKGRNQELGEQTYSEPRKWMRGKGRVTIQFGCCYNYAREKEGNPPGILKNAVPDPLPDLFMVMIRRLVRWHVLPAAATPDSCIVNIYEPGDCIPPHVDSHDFLRPFCTVSFLSQCDIVLGSSLRVSGPGEFSGSSAISLPVGSVLVMNGNGADIAKHCVPAVPAKRISITFRKMEESKWPTLYVPEPDLLNIQPLGFTAEEAKGYSYDTEIESSRKRKRSEDVRSNASSPRANSSERHSNDSGHPHSRRSISGHWRDKDVRRRSGVGY